MNRPFNIQLGIFFTIIIILSSCKTNEFSSNSIIQKRKHLKGYYFNLPVKKELQTAANINYRQVNNYQATHQITANTDSKNATTLKLIKTAPTSETKESNKVVESRLSPVEFQKIKSKGENTVLKEARFIRKAQDQIKFDSTGEGNDKDTDVENPNDIIALLSMIFGISSIVFLFSPLGLLSILLAPAAIIFGFIGLNSSRRGMAIAGIVTGFVLILLVILFLILFIALIAAFI